MSDFAYAQSTIRCREGDALLAAYAENAPITRATRFFLGQLRDSWRTVWVLTKLAEVMTSQLAPRSAVLCGLILAVGAGPRHFEAFSSCNGSLGKLFSALLREDYQHLMRLSSVLFRATMQVAANPTA
jgi:hypothetical protein